MSRFIHTWLAIPATIFILLIALSGSILSLQTFNEAALAPKLSSSQMPLATLVDKVVQHYPGVEQLTRTQNGVFIVSYSDDQGVGEDQIDPMTGLKVAGYQRSDLYRWMKQFHRSMQMGDMGRVLVAFVAFTLLGLSISGLCLMIRRLGGFKYFFKLAKGSRSQRLHIELSRFAFIGILVLTLTALYLSATTFALLPEVSPAEPDYPALVKTEAKTGGNAEQHISPIAVAHFPALKGVEAKVLVSLEFPYGQDLNAVFRLETQLGLGYIHPSTGLWLDFQAHSNYYQISQFIHALHTGEGMGIWTLLLGLTSFILPLIGVTGLFIWWQKVRRAQSQRSQVNIPSQEANMLVLVGSEGLSTWHFAQAFSQALRQAGNKVHLNEMNQVQGQYAKATHVFLMTSTYGEGHAPSNASLFLEKAKSLCLPRGCQVSVLGFGDRQFTHFVGFAKQVEKYVQDRGFKQILPFTAIDRFCLKSLDAWIAQVSACLNQSVCLSLDKPQMTPFYIQLEAQHLYGEEVHAPVRILEFKASHHASAVLNPSQEEAVMKQDEGSWPEFEVGDLVGIMPPGSDFPRYYSLASCDKEGKLEICVRKQVDGECSSFLHGLKEGDVIRVFIQKKATFRPAQDASAVILIGAGTGMAPLQGFIQQNDQQVPYYLYWGGRRQNSDFIYEDKLNKALATSRLTQLRLAFSRSAQPQYVQHLLAQDAKTICQRILDGAQIMVCGSQTMAAGVRVTLDGILKAEKLSVAELERRGRYLQDVY